MYTLKNLIDWRRKIGREFLNELSRPQLLRRDRGRFSVTFNRKLARNHRLYVFQRAFLHNIHGEEQPVTFPSGHWDPF